MSRLLPLLLLSLTACADQGAMTLDALAPGNAPYAAFSAGQVDKTGAWSGEQSAQMEPEEDADGRDATERKVIRTGTISVTVETYAPFETALQDWLTDNGGQITHENVSHNAGEVGWSALTLRVPSDGLDTLTSWLEETVEVSHLSVSSEDVTRTWVDLTARLDNAKRTETRLLGLLDTDAESLTDVLAVERELSRVRGDVESMEAQKRSLDSQIAMSTLSIDVTVAAPYRPTVAASFPQRIGTVFAGSLSAMGHTGEAALLAGVAMSPWLAVFGGGLWGLLTLRRRRKAAVA